MNIRTAFSLAAMCFAPMGCRDVGRMGIQRRLFLGPIIPLFHHSIFPVVRVLTVLLLFTLAGVALCHAGVLDPKLEALLAEAGSQERIPVIISLADKVDVHQFRSRDKKVRRSHMIKAFRQRYEETVSRSSLKGLLGRLGQTEPGGMHVRPLWMLNGLAVKARPQVIRTLAQKPWVETVRLDQTIQVPPRITTFAGPPEWNLSAVGVQGLWSLGYTGQGVVVATVDTGADVGHPDLATRWRGGTNSWFDANDPDFNPLLDTEPYDVDGHGTAVMGILVGGDAGGSSIGMAPGAQWIAAKIFDASGEALESEVHAAFQWMLDPDDNPDTDDAPDIVNNSWGFGQDPDVCIEETGGISFRTDVQILKQAGIAIVFSAGNGGPAPYTSVSPANYPESFSVGAVDETQNIADFSARGPSACGEAVYPSVTAPGDRAASPFGIKTADLTLGLPIPSYIYVMGTSISAPHASGAMALLLSAYPDLTPYQLEMALKLSALDLGPVGPDNDYGYGQIDALGAHGAVQGFDEVTISDVFYDDAAKTLTVVATSTAQPNVTLAAEVLGPLDWKSWKNIYRSTFTGVQTPPSKVTVVSSAGGTDTWTPITDDTVTITSVIHDPGADRLTVVATSTAQPDVVLTAEGLGPLAWKSWKNSYRNTFFGIADPPASVTVSSTGGGSDTLAAADIVTIASVMYDAGAGTLTVVATSTDQPDVALTAEGLGPLAWKNWKNFYRSTFSGIADPPAMLTVSSSGGGTATVPVP